MAVSRHPISLTKRISITYRCYRTSLTPQATPRCKCPLPGILRTVIDQKSPNAGRYFWVCQGGYRGLGEAREGCGWFEWAKFGRDGELLTGEGTKEWCWRMNTWVQLVMIWVLGSQSQSRSSRSLQVWIIHRSELCGGVGWASMLGSVVSSVPLRRSRLTYFRHLECSKLRIT